MDKGRLVRTWLTDRSASLRVQFVRYTIVGGVAFGVDFGTLAALTELAGLHYLVSAALAFCAGLATNYALSLRWVFDRRTVRNPVAEFAVFAGIGVVGLGLNEAFLWGLTEVAGLHYLASKIVATGGVYLWNFGVRKAILFR